MDIRQDTMLFVILFCFGLAHSKNPVLEIPREKACSGTNNGLSYSSSFIRHFHKIRRRFKGCTHVNGNLEITHLVVENFDYDMSFLKDIRYVSGYVLIATNNKIDKLELPNLETIRGNQTISIGGRDYSLAVVLNYKFGDPGIGLKQLHFPALREISIGSILFSQNPGLCFIHTIDWSAISGRGPESINMVISEDQPPFNRNCGECAVSCEVDNTTRCWGDNPTLCQRILPNICHSSCPYRCYGPGPDGCCHGNCAGGCWGPKDTECNMCKDYRLWNQCVGSCPVNYSKLNQYCYK
ncbi:hypothetical protein LOTGIDRAFT_238157 [Lottia gigantea]|uniref:receptor protein-tyrosine kinase n=1 Tax=Lottia gigantea TaxID=225164 RepID=V4B272_LOTGI|nr:hypothetical protein LOTGIDRAFT_238157 [Lottia gigantea]ESP01756.1 hypothetical protein LOTGIDRAFT_238157 [Lottia gigantea]